MPRRAVIDIGTNSVKMLVADVEGNRVVPVAERMEQTRLGRGFYASRRLQPEAIAHTVSAVAGFARQARDLGATVCRAMATSATREAQNAAEFLDAVQRAAGLTIEVITGDQEADLAFRGVTSDPRLAGRPLLILDVGGGSSEFIAGRDGVPCFRRSYPIGVVRLLEQAPPGDPPHLAERDACRERVMRFLRAEVLPRLGPVLASLPEGPCCFVGTGGTASVLGAMELQMTRFDREQLDATRLDRHRVEYHFNHLWSLPLGERRRVPGLPPERADVILPGVTLYASVMECFGLRTLQITTRGLRFAALLDAAL